MEEVSIKVNIAGRTYPLTIDKQQEAMIREAERKLGESVDLFQKNYAVKDKQDLLAMAALQVIAGNVNQAVPSTPQIPVDELKQELIALEKSIDSHLT